MFKKMMIGLVACGIALTNAFAQEAAQNADETKKGEDKLLRLMTMEQAFASSLQTRNVLAQYIKQQAEELKKADDTKKQEIEKNLASARRRLAEINTYMDVIYGLGGQRTYEYNRVTSEIFLRVGTVSEVFTRAVTARDLLAKQIAANKEAIDKEKDAAKKENMEKIQAISVRRYALISNALYHIFKIHPKRNYHFDAATRTLFLKTNDEEIAKLQAQIKESEAQKPEKKN